MNSEIELKTQFDPKDMEGIVRLHNLTELKRNPGNMEKFRSAYQNSYRVVTVWNEREIIGSGRVISDGEMYSSIFDVVVHPKFQKMGIGKRIMDALIKDLRHTCIYLTSTFGNEPFYEKLGFRKHKTALALYPEKMKNSPYLESETFK